MPVSLGSWGQEDAPQVKTLAGEPPVAPKKTRPELSHTA